MPSKITIIGAGTVGSTIAYALTIRQLASEIVMIDIDKRRAMGEAMDIRQGTPFIGPVSVRDGDYEDARGSDIAIITSGVARRPGQSRLDLAQTNVNIIKSIIPELVRTLPDALVVVVANPVDILTYQVARYSGLPHNHIFGSGTMLDTARFRARLAELYRVAQENVHGYVLGEHGDSSFVPWSLANIGSIPMEIFAASSTEKRGFPPLNKDDVEGYIRKSGALIISAKKATNYAIGVTTAALCEALRYDTDSLITLSSMLEGEYGISDVSLSVPTIIGARGITARITAPLTAEELGKLEHSAQCLKDVIAQLQF